MLSRLSDLRSTLLTLLFIGFHFIGFSQIHVNTGGSDMTGDGSIGNPYATIQNAINLAAPGETIIVAAGTYNENVIIDKSLTIQGPNVAVSGSSPRGGEAIIEPASQGNGVEIDADDVTIDGMQVGIVNVDAAIYATDHTGITIQNMVINADSVGIAMVGTGVLGGSIDINNNAITISDFQTTNTNSLATGVALVGLSGTVDVDLTNNVYMGGAQAIFVFGCLSSAILNISDEAVTNAIRGISVFSFNGVIRASSTLEVNGMSVTSFDEPVSGITNFPQAGIYFFTDGSSTDSHVLTATVNNCSFSGTSNTASDYAGVICGDFSSTNYGTLLQDITINETTFSNNENRGIQIRGQNTDVEINRSTFQNNGFDPVGAGGNHGFNVVVRNGAIASITNSFFTNPATQTSDEFDGLSLQAGSSLAISNSFFDQNGNGTIASTTGIDLSSNYFGTSDESAISALVGTGNDFTPWIPNDTDTNTGTAGFQPDLDSLYVGSTGVQIQTSGRIDEAITLVNAGGTVIVQSGSYSENVTVGKAVSLLGANQGTSGSGTRIGETMIDPATASVGITINSDNVTIDGFQLGTSSSSSNHSTALLNMGHSGFIARNSIIYSNGFGVTISSVSSGTVEISNNLVSMLNLEDPQNANTPSIGISVSSISGTADIDIIQNDITNASYGIGGYALTSEVITLFSGGTITGCTQGLAITNTNGIGGYSRSIGSIEYIVMSGFTGPDIDLAAPDAQAGIYAGTFTDGSTTTTADSIELTITGVDISETEVAGTDYAAINIVDFAGTFPFIDDDGVAVNVTVIDANLHNNDNRGFTLRGVNATATVTRSTIADNGNAAVVVSRLGHVTLTNNFLENPPTGTPTLLQTQTDATLTATDNHMTYESGSLADGQDANDKLNLSRNYLGTTTEATITGLIDNTNTDYSPWIDSGVDTNPSFAGFQPELDTLHVGTLGDQMAGGIIQEGHDLIDTLGTIVVNGNSYATDTLDVLKDITLSPLVSLTIDELVTEGGNLIVDNDLTITSVLTLNNGYIDLDLDDGNKTDDPVLTITGATVSGSFSDANHIEGIVQSDVAGAVSVDFPVGDEGSYRPVTVTPSNASTFQVAHYAESAPAGGGSSNSNLSDLVGDVSTALGPAVIQSALTTRYWNIDRTAGSGNANVGLQVLDSDMEVEPGTLSMTRLNSSGDWEEITRIGESGSDPYVVTGQTADFSEFSLVSAFGMAPGNVSSGLQLWLRADAGTSTTIDNTSITLWSDMSGVGTNASGATSPPLFRNDPSFNFNFNPVIVTDGLNDTLSTVINPIADSDDFTLFMVANNENMVTRGATGEGDGWSIRSASSVFTTNPSDVAEAVTGLTTTTTPTIHTLAFDQGISLSGYRNGTAGTPDNAVGSDLRNSTDSLNIGIDDTGFEAGSIAELIMYNQAYTGAERERIESYLAVKYGITLPNNYLAADGGIIWDISAASAGYNNDIAGIGRDDLSSLDQRKSRTINGDSLVTIALGNFDSPTSFDNNDAWLLWGNDDGVTTFGTLIDNAHAGTSNRIGRVWRVQETGTVGTVELAFNASASTETISLIVHPSDPTFPNNANREIYEMIYSTSTNDYRVSVDLTNGDYFTFAEGPVRGIPAVLISEVITDPQQDWSADGFHNPSPASGGTINSDDDWIELFVTESNVNLSGYTIDLIDSDTVSGGLGAGEAFTVSNYNSTSGGLFQATDSGDFVILGNLVTGAMNQDIQVVLRDANGDVVDQVLIESVSRGTGFNGNSTNAEDESVTRLFNDSDTNDDSNDFVLTKASLGTTDLLTGTVLINEVVTDPQRDWNTFSFTGNPPEDGATSGANDEWIELYIGADSLNLTNWTIEMIDGSDVSGELTLVSSGGVFNFTSYISANSGTFTDTRAGDYLVLGDPTGDMINDVYVVLRDPSGNIIDEVELGSDRAADGIGNEAPNGNATNNSLIDEAVARYTNAVNTGAPNNDFIQTYATPGATNSRSGTVVINEVVTNPQQDWSANNFDGTIGGNSTPSDTDDWIELYIGEDNLNLTNWSIEVTDNQFFSGSLASGGAFQSSIYFGSGTFLDTRAGDYLVLGNPTGSENITADALIRVMDATGTEIDKVEIGDDIEGDGNGDGAPDGDGAGSLSTGLNDESISRIPNATDTGDDVADFSHSTATLGRANAIVPTVYVGNALDFDGSDDEVNIGDVLLEAIGAVTIETWIYTHSFSGPSATTDIRTILSKGNSEDDAGSVGIYFEGDGSSSSNLIVALDNGTTKEELSFEVVATGITLNTWHHIAVGWTAGSGFNVYLDGVLIGTSTALTGILANTSDAFFLGNSTDPDEDHFDGLIDEVRIWNDERTQEEILENLNTTVDIEDIDLLAYYRFDHSSGLSVINLADNVFDGTLEAGMTDDDWVIADWPVFAENSTIVQSASGNQLSSASGQLSILNSTFLIDNDDILLIGHESSDFDTVTTLLPTGTLVSNRYARSWHLTKNDAAGTDGGIVNMSFEIGQEPDSSLTYYLLESSDPVTNFAITPIVGYQSGATSIDFTVDVDSLTNEQFYALGWSDAGPGNALDFDGTDDIVVIADDNSLDLTTTATWEFWINVDDITATSGILDKRTNVTTANAFSIGFNSGGTAIGSNFGIEATSNGTTNNLGASIDRTLFANGSWHHVAITYNSGAVNNFEIFLDGLSQSLVTSIDIDAALFNSSEELIIGSLDNGTTGFFAGQIDEVRIWNDVRTQGEILEYMNTNLAGDEANLVVYYRFNQGIGNDPYNLPGLSGSNNNGQLQGFDNLGVSTATSNFVTADRSNLTSGVSIINTTVDVLTNSSEELTLTSTLSDFLQDERDFIAWGHDGNSFVEVTTDLPSTSNLTTRIDRTWQLTKGDVNGNAGLVTFAFDLATTPDSDFTYYLLQRSGTSGTFDITEVLGSYPDGDSVKFTVEASQITSRNYFTLGRSGTGPGHAVDFDGSDDYIAVADNALLDITGALTLETWMNPDILPPSANEGLIAKYASGGNFSYSLELNTSGNIVFNISNDGTNSITLTSSSTLNVDEWTSVAATYDPGNSMSIYINGVLDATSTSAIPASIFNGTADLWLGATTLINADSILDGALDEVRIWNDVRSATEIQNNLYRSLDVSNESNLVAYYKFDDGLASGSNTSADSLVDYSGNDHVGVLNSFSLSGGASNWIISEAPLADESAVSALDGPGNALAFDGSNEYVEITDNDVLDITGPLTLEAWISVSSSPTTDNEGIISKFLSAGNERSYSLDITTSDNLEFILSANGTNEAALTSSSIITSADGWAHVAAVFDPSNSMSLYINGILDAELTAGVPVSINASSANLWVGMTNSVSANNALHVEIDEVRIWNIARTRVEIQDNMFKQLEGSETGLVAYYTFDGLAVAATDTLTDLTSNTLTGNLTNMEPTSDWVTATAREPEKNIEVNNWNTTTTWKSRAVPDAVSEQLDLSQDITVDGPINVDLLNINSGVTVTISTGQTLTVNGNFINNGAIVGDGTLVISGGSPALYGGTINNLQLSSANAILMSTTTISNTLDLSSNSTLNIDDYNLTINQISGFSNTAYIETKDQNTPSGYVIKSLAVADGDFVFPLASNNSYTPLTVTNLGSTGNIEARVFDNTYAQGTSGVIIDTEKEVNKSWEINGDAGVNVTVTLQWNATDEDPNYASGRSTAYMSKNDYDWWEKITPDIGATGSDPYEITASGIQTFSVFGTGTDDSSLPVTWLAFDAFENEQQEVELYWSTATELNNDRFEIEKSYNGKDFEMIGEVLGQGTINSQSNYQFVDTTPSDGINYYRLRQVDFDGTDDYSELKSVFVDFRREFNISLSPNPTFDVSVLRIDWDRDQHYSVGIFDLMGRNLGVVQSKFSRLNLDMSQLPIGLYIIKIHTGDRVISKKLMKR